MAFWLAALARLSNWNPFQQDRLGSRPLRQEAQPSLQELFDQLFLKHHISHILNYSKWAFLVLEPWLEASRCCGRSVWAGAMVLVAAVIPFPRLTNPSINQFKPNLHHKLRISATCIRFEGFTASPTMPAKSITHHRTSSTSLLSCPRLPWRAPPNYDIPHLAPMAVDRRLQERRKRILREILGWRQGT